MRIVVDTNIAFSAILNTNSIFARIILQPKSKLNFYSTDLLALEIEEHQDKLKNLAGYSNWELNRIISLIISKVRFIDANLIPTKVFLETENLLSDIDLNDTEFVALTTHIKGKLWSGDKKLQTGLIKKGWKRFISTDELYKIINLRK